MAFEKDFDYTAPYREMQPKANNPTMAEVLVGLKNNLHTALDIGGMVPGVGMAPDAINAAIYASKGDKSNAVLSAAAMVPVAGLGAGAGKIFKQIYDKMRKVGVDGLNRTEKSYINRNFDNFKKDVDLKRKHKDDSIEFAGRKIRPQYRRSFNSDESFNVAHFRHLEDMKLEGLHKTMKKSVNNRSNLRLHADLMHGEKSIFGKGPGQRAIQETVLENPQKLLDRIDLNLTETNKMATAMANRDPFHPNRLSLDNKIADLNILKDDVQVLMDKGIQDMKPLPDLDDLPF